MNKTALLMLLAATVFFAACGPSYVPPANNATNKGPVKPKKDYSADYNRESQAAVAAQNKYKGSQSDEDIVEWMVRVYNSLKYVNLHRKENGEDSTKSWSQLGRITEMRADFKSIAATAKASENSKVKAAKHEWEQSTN
ncbi:MAG: hypothetical protein IT462_02035 [Planctomycetes bacterium]|nr:hypothetical protein [Planctomycetota bacterium]